jgi:hypothetical protein
MGATHPSKPHRGHEIKTQSFMTRPLPVHSIYLLPIGTGRGLLEGEAERGSTVASARAGDRVDRGARDHLLAHPELGVREHGVVVRFIAALDRVEHAVV